jgi:hypothetical protein
VKRSADYQHTIDRYNFLTTANNRRCRHHAEERAMLLRTINMIERAYWNAYVRIDREKALYDEYRW